LWSRGEGLTLSFGELAAAVAERAKGLHLPQGSLAAVATGNLAAFPVLFFALLSQGVPMVAMDGALAPEEKRALCCRLGVHTLFTRAADGLGEEVGGGVRRLDLGPTPGGSDTLPALPADGPATTGPATSGPAPGTALVKMTSGSTGEPTGICLSEEALATGIAQIVEGMGLSAADRVLIAIPLSHSYGFDNGVLSLAAAGTPLILEPSYYPASLLRALGDGEATFFPAVPPMVRALADTDWPRELTRAGELGRLRVISAGGPLDPSFARRFRKRSGRAVHQFYGSTETGGICFERHPEEPEASGTVGQPLPGVRVELDRASTVTVDSGASFLAFLGQPPRPERRVVLGDRGEWTAEGRLRLTGRTADMLNVGGRRVSATAIESCLRRLPGITEVAVVAVADPMRGDRVMAFFVGEPGRLDPSCLPTGLAPRDLRAIDALPYTPRGKLDRARLRRLAAEG